MSKYFNAIAVDDGFECYFKDFIHYIYAIYQ